MPKRKRRISSFTNPIRKRRAYMFANWKDSQDSQSKDYKEDKDGTIYLVKTKIYNELTKVWL